MKYVLAWFGATCVLTALAVMVSAGEKLGSQDGHSWGVQLGATALIAWPIFALITTLFVALFATEDL